MLTYVIRKQLYIDEDQERLLKQRSRELGVSEAELVRRALDTALQDPDPALTLPRSGEAIAEYLTEADRIAATTTIDWPASRDELYAERIDRLMSRLSDPPE